MPTVRRSHEVGAYLRAWRTSNDQSIRQLEALSGIDRGTLSRIERGEEEPLLGTFARIIEALGLSDGALMQVLALAGRQPVPTPGADVYSVGDQGGVVMLPPHNHCATCGRCGGPVVTSNIDDAPLCGKCVDTPEAPNE